jgi:hypothetical protein
MAKEKFRDISQLLQHILDRMTPATVRDLGTYSAASLKKPQLAMAIKIQLENLAAEQGLGSQLALLTDEDYTAAAEDLKDRVKEVKRGTAPPRAPKAPKAPAAAAPAAAAGPRRAAGATLFGLNIKGPDTRGVGRGGEEFGEAVEGLRGTRKKAADSVPGIVTERQKRGGRFPREAVRRRYSRIFGKGVRAGRRLHLGPTAGKQLLRLGGIGIGAHLVAGAAGEFMGIPEKREMRRQRLQLGVASLSRRLQEGILTPEDVHRKQRLQNAIDFKTMMLTQKDPSLAQLMMGLPETTQSEFIIGAKPNHRRLRDAVEQETLEAEVARDLDMTE